MTAVLQRASLKPRLGRINKLDVWLAAMLLTPRRAMVSMIVCIAVFCILGFFVLVLTTAAEDLFMDSTEAYAWGMQFLGGYGRHPPLTGWIATLRDLRLSKSSFVTGKLTTMVPRAWPPGGISVSGGIAAKA